MCACICTCVWKPEFNAECAVPLELFTLYFERGSVTGTRALTTRNDWLATQLQESSCVFLPRAGAKSTHLSFHFFFPHGYWGPNSGPHTRATNTLANEPISPAPEFSICLKSKVDAALKIIHSSISPSNSARRNLLLSKTRQRDPQGAEAISELCGHDEAAMPDEEPEGRKMGKEWERHMQKRWITVGTNAV